jgi:hypothetical protein
LLPVLYVGKQNLLDICEWNHEIIKRYKYILKLNKRCIGSGLSLWIDHGRVSYEVLSSWNQTESIVNVFSLLLNFCIYYKLIYDIRI